LKEGAGVKDGNNFGHLLSAAYSGYVNATGVEAIDELLTFGGAVIADAQA
jgi:NhaC family Na+:H+ antiporter